MKLAIARVLIRLLSLIPLKVLYYSAVPLGLLIALLPSRKQAVIDRNLAIAFPELDERGRNRLRRQHLIEMVRLVMESGAVWHWSSDRILRHVREVDGWTHVEQARRSGRGYLMIGAHIGNWEILTLYGTIREPFACLYKTPSSPEVDALITRSRQRFGGKLIASGSPAMRQLLRQLKAGRGAGLLADQQPKQGEGIFAPFFGTEALTMTLVNRLARRTGCAVFFSDARRLAGGRGWSIEFRPADERIAAEDPTVAIACINEWLEEKIRATPAQYLWSYKRFGIRP
ncbi:MAG: lysophospholipid acyltransferase family protein, partial [Wenzhouxiangella sp.]